MTSPKPIGILATEEDDPTCKYCDGLTFQLFAEAKNRMIHPDAMLEAVEGSGIDGGLETVERKMQSAYYDGNTSGSYGSKVSAYWLPNFVFKAYVGGKPVDRPPADPVAWKAANSDNLPRVFAGDPQLAGNAATDLTIGGTTYSELRSYFDALLSASGNRDRLAKRFGDVADIPQVPWTILGWLSQNAAWIVYGESGSFKTYITLNMLLCVATGTPFATREGFEGYAVGAPRPVILFAGESHSGVVQRVHAAIKGNRFNRKLVDQNLILVRDVYALNHSDGLARMADEIQALGVRPAIIAVDTLNLALDGNEDSSDETKRALRGLRALATMFDATGLAIDHVGHGDKSRPRGSSAKKANSDGMILCERHGDTKNVSLTQHKNRDDDQTKYRAAFTGKVVDLGACPKTGQSTVNLCFNAIDAAESGSAKSKFHPTGAENKVIMSAVARAVMARLAANRTKAWSHSALADAVATDATIGITGSTLRQRHLKSLREDSSNPVSRCYDAGTGRWLYWEA